MNKQIVIAQLREFGLDEIEVKIYLDLLENGPKTPLELSRETSLNRSRIYRYLDKLKQKKLIEESNIGRGLTLKAANPNNFELLIMEKAQELKREQEALPNLLKELTSLPTNIQRVFEVKYYQGKEGIKQMLWNQLSASNREIVAFSFRNKNEMVGKSFAEKIREEQVSRKIILYEVENETDQGNYWYTDVLNWGKYYRSRYIPPKILEIKQYIGVFNNTVSIINWVDGEEVGIEIVNSIYTNTQRQIFWKFWDIAEAYIKEGKRLEAVKKSNDL